MNHSADLYARVPGWVAQEDLTAFNRENDPVILRKVQQRAAAKSEER